MGAATPQERVTNRDALQRYVADGLTLPQGTLEVDVSAGPVLVPAGASITDATIDAYPKKPWGQWRLFESTASNGTITLSGLTIHGPTTVDPVDNTNLRYADVFLWHGTGNLVVDNVTVTGRPARCIEFSGVGDCTVTNSSLNGYVSPIARWDATVAENPGVMLVDGCTITGYEGGDTSVGIYVHPHFPITVTNTAFDTFNRYGLYQNGNVSAVGDAVVEDCTFRRCAVIQSGSQSTATIRRIEWTDPSYTPGSIIRGNAVIEDSLFEVGPWASFVGTGKSIAFRRCTWTAVAGYGCNLSTTDLTVVFEDCTWAAPEVFLVMIAGSSGSVTFTGCTIDDTGTAGLGFGGNIQGTVTLDRRGLVLITSRTFWNLGAGVTVID